MRVLVLGYNSVGAVLVNALGGHGHQIIWCGPSDQHPRACPVLVAPPPPFWCATPRFTTWLYDAYERWLVTLCGPAVPALFQRHQITPITPMADQRAPTQIGVLDLTQFVAHLATRITTSYAPTRVAAPAVVDSQAASPTLVTATGQRWSGDVLFVARPLPLRPLLWATAPALLPHAWLDQHQTPDSTQWTLAVPAPAAPPPTAPYLVATATPAPAWLPFPYLTPVSPPATRSGGGLAPHHSGTCGIEQQPHVWLTTLRGPAGAFALQALGSWAQARVGTPVRGD